MKTLLFLTLVATFYIFTNFNARTGATEYGGEQCPYAEAFTTEHPKCVPPPVYEKETVIPETKVEPVPVDNYAPDLK